MEYTVTFIKYYEYTVEAESAEEAVDEAYEVFRTQMRQPVADTTYDDIEVLDEDGHEV